MYTEFYGFREKPFSIVPDPGFFYLSPKHRMALSHLEYALMDRIGFILLTGEIGTGKTTIIKKFLSQIQGETEVAVIFNTNVSGDQLLQLILNEFQVEPPGQGKPSQLIALNRFLVQQYSAGRQVFLIVDEAQNLTEEGLEEIRMLSNLQTQKESLLQILLVGQPALRVKLENPSLTQLTQRIAVSYHISPLSLDETREYVLHRLKRAGAPDEDIFSPEALALIFEHSGGIPRMINILCDGSLVYGYADELKTVDATVVQQLVKDKQELGVFSHPRATHEMSFDDGNRSGDTAELAQRIVSLEGRVNKLLLTLDDLGQIQGNRISADDHPLIRRLERRLAEERNRGDSLLGDLNRLRADLDSLHANSRDKEEQQPDTEYRPHPPSEPVSAKGESRADKCRIRRVVRWITKWFVG